MVTNPAHAPKQETRPWIVWKIHTGLMHRSYMIVWCKIVSRTCYSYKLVLILLKCIKIRQNFHENNAKSYKTYIIITYFDAPKCIKISPKLPKIAYFPGAFPPGSPPGLCPWTPPGGLKRPPGPTANLAKIVSRIRTPWVLDPGYTQISLYRNHLCGPSRADIFNRM